MIMKIKSQRKLDQTQLFERRYRKFKKGYNYFKIVKWIEKKI